MSGSVRPCSVIGCPSTVHARNLCHKHYLRWKSNGDPLVVRKHFGESSADRLLRYTPVRPENGCWEWAGAKFPTGYGAVRHDNRTLRAHRVAYEIWVGPIPAEAMLRHTCDNYGCVNPAHLVPGSAQDNSDDMTTRWRSLIGSTNHESKLTEGDVAQIRRLLRTTTLSQQAIADRFGVSQVLVSRIKRRMAWKHVA